MLKYLLILLTTLSLGSCIATPEMQVPANQQANQQTSKVLYIDVREPSEWSEGHIEGALLVPLGQIESGNYSPIPKGIPVFIYCRSGRRSALAVQALRNAGYTNITNAGGMTSIAGVAIVK